MTLRERIAQRGITSVVHFTTNKGALGIFDSRAVKPREQLDTDQRLEHIFMANAADRSRDAQWLGHVNLSVSSINSDFFERSAGGWHRDKDLWWCILDFSPEIMEHPGVHFATTNNMYSNVKRAPGVEGFEAMFAPRIIRWYRAGDARAIVDRAPGTPDNVTTDYQAEVLYPGPLSTEFLARIYVHDEDSADELAAQLTVTNHPAVPVEVRPDWFTAIR